MGTSSGFRSEAMLFKYFGGIPVFAGPGFGIHHIPDRSGLPSGARGVGADRLGLPSAVRGMFECLTFSHCARAGAAESITTNNKCGVFICSPLGHASAAEGVFQTIIPLMTGVFPERPVDLLDGHFPRPGLSPHPWIFNRELIKKRVFISARETFNHVQVLCSLERSLICEISGVDNQRVALPTTDRVAHPLADVLWQMRTPVQANDADVVDLLSFDGQVSRTLHDLKIAVVAGGEQRWSNVIPSNATCAQRPVLRAVEFMSLFLSRHLGESLSGFRRQGRDGSFRSDNQRCSAVPGKSGLKPVQSELGVIVMYILRRCAWDARMVRRRLTLNIVHSEAIALPLLDVCQLCFRIEFFPCELLGPLQGCHGIVGPYALKVRLAVGRT